MAILRGVHFANFQYLDPFGIFPGKPSVRPSITDSQLFDDMCKKIEEAGAKSIKILLSTFAGDPNQGQWLQVQQEIVVELHRRFSQAALILRLMHKSYLGPNIEAAAAQMAQDFQPIINTITDAVQDAHGQPAIWIIVGNEPNHSDEGFNQDPVYFNKWFKAVVWHFWNTNPIPSHYDGGPHGIFYPGLSPNPSLNPLAWYQHPSTLEILHPTIENPDGSHSQQCWCNGVALHVYWQTGQLADPDWGEFYKAMWTQGIEPINSSMPIIIGEWGNSSPDDMDTVKTPEYLAWLTNLNGQQTIPEEQLIAHCGFILEGTDDWSVFRWTHHLAQAIGALA